MKNMIKILAAVALALCFSGCTSLLDVTNPNRFTDEQMTEFIGSSPEAEKQVLSGLVGKLPECVNFMEAKMNGGYANSGEWESWKEFERFCQSGDVVEGDSQHPGDFAKWYQNLPSNTYWRTDDNVENYGYYLGPVFKYGFAQKALDFLTKEKVRQYPTMKAGRAQALTIKAMAYLALMERYTDFQDVASKDKQGWPVYDKFAYNAPMEPWSVADTWAWINEAFKEAVDLFKGSNLGSGGYTIGKESTEIHDIDCAIAQYYRCRAALDVKDWATAIEAGNDLLSHYPSFIKADDYGMKATLLESVNRRASLNETTTSAKNPGKWTGTDFNALQNAFYNLEKNPEAIFGEARGSVSWFWSLRGQSVNTFPGLNPLKKLGTPDGAFYQMDQKLAEAMTDADCRKACLLPEAFPAAHFYVAQGTDTTWYHFPMPKYTSLKWAASSAIQEPAHSNDKQTSDNIYLRSSAVLLMVAEAYAQSGQDAQAKALLDKLLAARTLPGNPAMTCANTMAGKSALDMVKLQWRLEMWGEGDWAFFNQKRWGVRNERGSNHWSKSLIPAQGFIWEIPRQERQGNPYWK